jgi:hypothetical protein
MKQVSEYFHVPSWTEPGIVIDVSPFKMKSAWDSPVDIVRSCETELLCRICHQPIQLGARFIWRERAHLHHFKVLYAARWVAPRPSLAARIRAALKRFFQRLWKRG